jgi:anti-sigma factor RsiW
MTPEQFELLSIYLDQETSPDERQRVEHWLSSDPHFRAVYQQQLQLRRAFLSLPTPPVDRDRVMEQVMARVQGRSPRRWLWSSVGAACLTAVTVAGSLLMPPLPAPRLDMGRQYGEPTPIAQEPLRLAMERPIVPMPPLVPQPGSDGVREAP